MPVGPSTFSSLPTTAARRRRPRSAGAEVYPTLCRRPGIAKSDDADARACCEWASATDLAKVLDLRQASAAVRRSARIEGWILGARAPA